MSSALLLAGLFIAILSQSAWATIGSGWLARNPLPTGESITAVTSSSTRMVAVGTHGVIYSSDDGFTWTPRTSGTTQDLFGVAFSPTGAGHFLAVGNNSTVVQSTDNGVTWAPKPAVGTDKLVSVAWTGTYFVAVGSSGITGVAQYTTPNAPTWTRAITGADPMLQVAALPSNKLLAITGKAIMTGTITTTIKFTKVATTGVTAADLPRSVVWTGTAAVLCTVNGGSPAFWTSTNAIAWNLPSVSSPVVSTPLRLSIAAGEVLGVGLAGDVWTANSNGSTWTHRATGENVELLGGGRLNSTPTTPYVVSGLGGRIFSAAPADANWVSRLSTGPVTNIMGVAVNGSTFVGVGENFSVTSPDGIAWTNQAQTDKTMRSVARMTGQYVAVGLGAWTSPDGITWTETIAPATAGELNRVIWTGSQLVAVGLNTATGRSQVLTSPDGTAWTEGVMPAASIKKLNGAASFGPLTVAVGDGGFVVISPDSGVNWTKVAVVLKKDENFTDVAFGNNLFVAVTNLGGIWTSASGAKWINRKAASSGSLNRVIRAGNQFVAIGAGGKQAYSFGGIEWVITDANSSQDLRDLAYTGPTDPPEDAILAVVGNSGAILTSEGDEPARPALTFNSAAVAGSESTGTATLNLTLSPPSPLPVTVLFTLSGTAVQGKTATSDYTVSTLPLKFLPGGPTTLPISITIKPDNLDEVNETAIFSLGAPTGDATLGSPYVHTMTINDDDQIPTFTAQPTHQLVNVGAPASLSATVAASGTPGTTLTAAWKKGAAAAAGITPSFTPVVIPQGATFNAAFPSATLTQAGAYTVTVKNPTGSATSAIAQLGVVDNTPQAVNLAADTTATLIVKAAGTGLSYQWLKNGAPLSNSTDLRITGTTTTKLVIKEMSFGDNATYACQVTQTTPTSSNTILGCTTVLGVVVSAPVITSTSLPSTTIGLPYDVTLTASGSPNNWTIAAGDLPAGLTFNTITGRLNGKVAEPLVAAADLNLRFTAANIIGTGPEKTLTLHVEPLPAGALGSYTGLIERSTELNSGINDVHKIGLGGRVQITVANTGAYTGSVVQGAATYPLTGFVTYNPTGPVVEISQVLSGQNVVTSNLKLTINPATRAITGGTNDAPAGINTAAFTGWRSDLWTSNPPSATAVPRREGRYTMFHPAANGTISQPRGNSYVVFGIDAAGNYTAVGRTADGAVYTHDGVMGATGEIPLYAGLYAPATPGALTGTLLVNEVADVDGGYLRNTVTGDLLWSKPDQGVNAPTRSYKAGFQGVVLTLSGITLPTKPNGGRYLPPVDPLNGLEPTEYARVYMGMNVSQTNNGRFSVSTVGVDLTTPRATQMNEVFSVSLASSGSTVTRKGLEDDGVISELTINPATGVFSGQYIISDQDLVNGGNTERTVNFFGTVVRDNVAVSSSAVWFGRGSTLVPRMPENGLPPTEVEDGSANPSPIQSGALQMLRNP